MERPARRRAEPKMALTSLSMVVEVGLMVATVVVVLGGRAVAVCVAVAVPDTDDEEEETTAVP